MFHPLIQPIGLITFCSWRWSEGSSLILDYDPHTLISPANLILNSQQPQFVSRNKLAAIFCLIKMKNKTKKITWNILYNCMRHATTKFHIKLYFSSHKSSKAQTDRQMERDDNMTFILNGGGKWIFDRSSD